MRRSEQRRAAVIALYQHDLTGRPLAETLGRETPRCSTRALAHAAADRAQELDEVIDRHAHGWSVQRIQPLERSIMRVALIEMLHPDVGAGATSRSRRRGRSRRRWRAPRRSAARTRPASSTACSAAVLREVRENAPQEIPMNETEQ